MNNTSLLSSQTTSRPMAAATELTDEAFFHRSARRPSFRPADIEWIALAGDLFVISLACIASAVFYKWTTPEFSIRGMGVFGIAVLVAFNFLLVNVARKNYRLKKLTSAKTQLREVLTVWAIVCGLLAVGGFAMKISSEYSRGAAFLFCALGLVLLSIWRMMIAHLIAHLMTIDAFAKTRILVIAEKHRALSSKPLQELRRLGFVPVHVCRLSEIEISSSGASASLRSKLAAAIDLARSQRVHSIYILVDWNYHRTINIIVQAINTLAIPVHLLPDESTARFLHKPAVEIGNTWSVTVRRPPLSPVELAIKRAFDLTGSLFGLIALAPLFLMTALLIKLDSKGPVFFRQSRNGFNGHSFSIFKFRTMRVLEDGPEIQQASRNDPRVTRIGKWLRRTSIDELPQLLNVVRGEMSLVGPRPHARSHDSKYEREIANYAFRQHVKPGLTGWAQINGYRGETPRIELMERRVDHDLWYINNWSFRLDFWIVLKTALTTVFQRSAY